MKLIIAGSRTLNSYDLERAVKAVKLNPREVTEVVCGCAPGIDQAGYRFARQYHKPVTYFPAWANQYNWALMKQRAGERIVYPKGGYSGYSLKHGYLRNAAMAEYGDALLSVWDGISKGSKNMREEAECHGLRLFYHTITL